jgi:hypothetical protein
MKDFQSNNNHFMQKNGKTLNWFIMFLRTNTQLFRKKNELVIYLFVLFYTY